MKNIVLLFVLILIVSSAVFCQEEGEVKTGDGSLHYKTFGKGYPILIINGGPGMNCDGFSSLAKLLSDKYMAILYDQRGTGKSNLLKVDSSTVTMDLMAQDIESLRQHLKIKEWIVLGHSFGGIMAQYYASKYPESIKTMILSGSGGIDMGVFDFIDATITNRLGKSEKDSLKYWGDKRQKGDTSFYAKLQWAKVLATVYVYDKKCAPQIAERLTQGKPQITGLVYKDLYKIGYDCKEALSHFEKPVLIIQGRQDIVGDETAYKEHQVLKNSKIVFLNECVHYGWLEQEEKYIAELKKFIDSAKS
jgi:proline iminopeptidase